MSKLLLREWKKVFEPDLVYVCYEMGELIDTPAVILLEGDLGAGKTTFTKSFLKDETFSPTYSIVSETTNAIHADFYRLKDEAEIVHLELPMYLEDKEYFFIEWGSKYLKNIINEVPDSFSFYQLDVQMADGPQKSGGEEKIPRNYFFHSLTID
jgi:tRNA threonylcarbamoyladenosine biosynthesis protein TsaE